MKRRITKSGHHGMPSPEDTAYLVVLTSTNEDFPTSIVIMEWSMNASYELKFVCVSGLTLSGEN